MFDDFQVSPAGHESQQRFRKSFAAALVLYAGTSAAVIAATATVRKIVQEELTTVEFAPPPPPEPEPPPLQPAAAPARSPRPKVKRPALAPPDKISDEKLKESNRELAAADESGPVDGFLDGTLGGRGNGRAVPPPPPPPAPLIAPVAVGSIDRPRYAPAARRKGIEGVVVVVFDVLEDGHVANPQIVSGPPELRDSVLKAALSWRFKPAHRGGKAVRYRMKRSIVFRLEDL